MNIKRFMLLIPIVFLVAILFFVVKGIESSENKQWILKSFDSNISYGGTVIKKNENSYRFNSRTNPLCPEDIVRCNKALISYKVKEPPISGKVVLYSFDLTIHQYHFDDAPNWWVLFQDWVRIDPDNRKGNRPISTLEVKSYGERLFLRHKDSAFQWGTDSSRTRQINNGELQIYLGQTYHVKIKLIQGISAASGGMSLIVDDKIISEVIYQTKSPSQWQENVEEFGIYHDKQFNLKHKAESNLDVSIDNLNRRVL